MRRIHMISSVRFIFTFCILFNFVAVTSSSAQTPFVCDSTMYMTIGTGFPATYALYKLNTAVYPASFDVVGSSTPTEINAIGYNPVDNFVYGISNGSITSDRYLIRIDAMGVFDTIGEIPGLFGLGTIYAGDFDNQGRLFVTVDIVAGSAFMYRIDFSNPNSIITTVINLVNANFPLVPALINIPDFAYSTDGKFWGKDNIGNRLISITVDGRVAAPGAIGSLPEITYYGSMYASSDGNIYGMGNDGTGIYQFNKSTGSRTLITDNPALFNVDGAHCRSEPIKFAADMKMSNSDNMDSYIPGSISTYNVIARNTGPANLYKAIVKDSVPSGITTMSYTAIAYGGSTTKITGTKFGNLIDTVTIPRGDSIVYTINVTVPSNYSGDLVQKATASMPLSGIFVDNAPANNIALDINTDPNVLPVNLLFFEGNWKNGGANISWGVSKELSFHHYELERSIDGFNFEKIAEIKAEKLSKYFYNDIVAGKIGNIYYRLKLVDIDGAIGNSSIIKLLIQDGAQVEVWPNPASELLNIKLNSNEEGMADIALVDGSGTTVYKKRSVLKNGFDRITITDLDVLSRGLYFLNITLNGKVITSKVSLQ